MGVETPVVVRRRLGGRGRLLVGLAVVAVLLGVLFGVRATAADRLQQWQTSCAARGGTAQTDARGGSNPLVAESGDPTYTCRSPDGQVLSTWR